nr:hypothetical protein [Pseudomonas amygdali]
MVPLGFHAHNNLSLALANASAAIEAGAEYIDTSICGMGAGNLHLSMLVAYLERIGVSHGFDLVKVIELSAVTANSIPHNNMPSR